MQSGPDARRTWSPAGARPVVRVKGGERNKLSLISAVNIDAELHFKIDADNITGTGIIEFLPSLLKEMDSSIVLVWDNGDPHRRKDVRLFLRENRKRLYTRRFPAYAPRLNPDERILNVLKYQELSNWRLDTAEEMKTRVKGAMSRLKKHLKWIRNAMAHSRLPLPSNHVD